MPYKNPEKKREYAKAYAEKNREKLNLANKKYYDKLVSDPIAKKLNNERKYKERDKRKISEVESFVVYFLPEEHYIGYTNSFDRRMREHRKVDSRRSSSKSLDTKGAIIIAKFKCPMEAHLYETQLHLRGFNGFKR